MDMRIQFSRGSVQTASFTRILKLQLERQRRNTRPYAVQKAIGLAGRSLQCCSGDGAVTWRHQALVISVISLRPVLAAVPEGNPSAFGADALRGSLYLDASVTSA